MKRVFLVSLALLCVFALGAFAASAHAADTSTSTRLVMIDGHLIPITHVEPVSVGDTRNFAKLDATAQSSRGHVLGDEFPGVVIYALGHGAWKSAIKITAPLDADVNFDASAGMVIGPNPGHLIVPKGGARVIYFDELRNYMRGDAPDIGVMKSAPAISVTSFLAFDDGHTKTSFSSNALLQSITSDKDLYRVGTVVNTLTTPLGPIGTDVTLFNYGDATNTVIVITYDENGAAVAGIEVIAGAHGIFQQQVQGNVKAGTLKMYRGCNVGPCFISDSPMYFLATSGPRSGGTVDTLKSQNIGSE
jgi:hypothetical protein